MTTCWVSSLRIAIQCEPPRESEGLLGDTGEDDTVSSSRWSPTSGCRRSRTRRTGSESMGYCGFPSPSPPPQLRFHQKGTGDRTRTCTSKGRWLLKPLRLPIPPPRHHPTTSEEITLYDTAMTRTIPERSRASQFRGAPATRSHPPRSAFSSISSRQHRRAEPPAGEEPLAGEEPSAYKEPTAGEEPSADKEPSANKEPSASSIESTRPRG